MLKKIRFSLIFLTLQPALSFGSSAISSAYVDTGRVQKLNLAPGVPTLLSFPCNIVAPLKDTAGNIEAAQVEGPRRLVVWLKSSASQPSQLTVICENQVFVFNIIPSRQHQSYLKIVGAYGSPELTGSKLNVLDSSTAQASTPKRVEGNKQRKVLATSGGTK